MKKIQKLLLLLLMMAMLLPTFAMAETPVIVNLVENPDAEYHFEDGAKILEIVFPRVYSSDCILLRYDGMVMMIDASTKNATMRNRIYTACDTIGIDHIDIAYNSHPHDDHIDGFQFVNEYAPISKFLITFPEDFNARMKSAVKFMKANNIPIEQIGNGDTFTLGEDGGVKMTVIQYHKSSWGVNDQSAMLMVQYLQNNGGKVTLEAIAKPDRELTSRLRVLELGLEHERYVTGLIHTLYEAAYSAKDFRTMQFLDWFVKEQGEEEKNAEDLIKKMKLYGEDAKGLYMLNSEMAARVYTAPSLVL
jgi:ferritin